MRPGTVARDLQTKLHKHFSRPGDIGAWTDRDHLYVGGQNDVKRRLYATALSRTGQHKPCGFRSGERQTDATPGAVYARAPVRLRLLRKREMCAPEG